MRQRTWGLTPGEWTEAEGRLRLVLEASARERGTITYGEAAREAFGGRFSARSGALMDLLASVDEEYAKETGLVIASLVVRADTGMPGDGYFAFLGGELGRDVRDRERAWRAEAVAVWDAFSEEGPS